MSASGLSVDAAADLHRVRPLPLWVTTLGRALRYGRTRVGVALTTVIVLAAVIGPWVAPHSPTTFVGAPFAPPSGAAPLGTDYQGHDVLSLALWGGRDILWMSVAATALGVGLGLLIGLIAGYSRNVLDDVLMRTLDILLAFPRIVVVLLFVSLLGPKTWLIVLIVALAWVPGVARVIRGITLETVTKEFVEAGEVLGVPRRRLLLQDVLPNVTTPLMVDVGLRLTWSISLIAGISFLGFGIQPPAVDWGLMINQSRNGLTAQPWAIVAPVCCIAAFTIGTNLIAEGIARTIAGVDREGRAR